MIASEYFLMHIEVYTYGVNVEKVAKVRLDGQRTQKKKKKEKSVKHNLTNYRSQMYVFRLLKTQLD